MRTLYGSTSWRRVLALVLVFVMMVSTMGTSGYSVFAEDLVETNEEVTVSEPEANVPEVTEDIQGPSPGEEESEAVVDPVEETEEPAEEEALPEEEGEDAELEEDAELVEEPAEEAELEEDAEPVEEQEEAELEEDEELVEEGEEGEEEAEPAEQAEDTLISEAAKVIEEDDGEEVAEEAVEELPEEPVEEPVVIDMPAIDAEKLFEDARVTVSAPEGAFPEGTEVSIEEVVLNRTQVATVAGAIEEKIVSYKAYDITFYNGDQTDMQPAEGYAVKVNIDPYSMPTAENLQVVHMETARKAEVVESEATEEGLVFDAEHFSIYVIVSGGETEEFRRTYHFMTEVDADGNASPFTFLNKAGEKVTIQVAKNGDKLETVNAPYTTGATLLGWYVLDETEDGYSYTDTELQFETALDLSALTEDDEVYVAPKYETVYYVTFHETAQGSADDILQTKKVVFTSGSDANKVLISDVIAPQPDARHIFYGWKLGETEYPVYDGQNSLQTTYIENLTGNVDLYPIFEKAFWVRFVAGEAGWRAKYVPAQFVLENDTVTKAPVSEREGYDFVGWYTGSMTDDGQIIYDDFQVTDENGNVKVSEGLKPDGDITLYAKWAAKADATYSVIFWRQKVTDDKNAADADKKYDYVSAESKTRMGSTGQVVSATQEDKSHSGGDYTGFHFARTEQNSTTINPNGSTVINVYYDRDVMAVNFYYRNGDQPEGASTAYTYTANATNSNEPQKYGVVNGEYVALRLDTEESYRIYYTYNSNGNPIEYAGTFYTRTENGGGCGGTTYSYTPTQYNGSNLPPNGNTTYYTENEQALTRRVEDNSTYNWSYNGEPYTGTRYTRSSMDGYPYMVTFTGLYGQSFEKYNYTWPADYRWNEQATGQGGTIQTLLNSFKQTENPYNLYDRGSVGDDIIYHYKQKTDGTYDQTKDFRFTAYGNGGNFNFSEKFDGFKVKTYSNRFSASGEGISALNTDGTPKQNVDVNYPLHVYHERQKFSITYKSEGTEVHTTGKTVYFEADLKDYNYDISKVDWLNEKDHYEFTGWYADEACTTLFDFNGKMPAADVVVYAGWEPIWYLIIVDPDGGIITTDIGSTYFWKQYEEKFDEYKIVRTYIEDPNGDYKYVYVDGSVNPDENNKVRTATYELAEEGYTGTKYRQMTASDDEYILVGWYVVDEDGNTTSTPYDFDAEVEAPVYIRAVWRLSGFYTVQYNATATVGDVEVSGTFTQTEPDAKYADRAEIIVQPAPTNVTQGYVFEGWEVVNENGEPLDSGNYYQPGDQLTLDATHWATSNRQIRLAAHYSKVETSDIPVEITFLKLDANGGAMAENAAAPTIEADKNGNSVTPVVNEAKTLVTYENLPINQDFDLETVAELFVREGYEFLGWSTNEKATSADFKVDDVVGIDNLESKDNTLYAVWKEIPTYTVTYTYDNSAPEGAPAVPTDSNAYAAEAEVTVKDDPKMEGYTFNGWKVTEPEGITISEGKFIMPASAVTVTGSWTKDEEPPVEPVTYTVTYTYDNSAPEGAPAAPKDSNAYAAEAEVTVKDDPKMEGYTFNGWKVTEPEGITISEGKFIMPASPVTVTGSWTKDEPITYTIIYHSNYKSAVSTETEDDPIAVEDATTIVTFNDVLGPNNQKFTKTSPWTNGNKTYTFAGWKDANGKEYPLGDYNGVGAILEGQTSGNDQQPATNEAGAVNTATSSLRSGLRMAFTTSFGGTLELWAQWTESTSGGGNNPRPRPNPDPTDEPEEPIDDPDTPLAPPEEEDTEIDDGDTPLAPGTIDEETEIDDEATPLTPFTGDDRNTVVWGIVSILSLAGIVVVARKRREEE